MVRRSCVTQILLACVTYLYAAINFFFNINVALPPSPLVQNIQRPFSSPPKVAVVNRLDWVYFFFFVGERAIEITSGFESLSSEVFETLVYLEKNSTC